MHFLKKKKVIKPEHDVTSFLVWNQMLAEIVHNYGEEIVPLSNTFGRFGHICIKNPTAQCYMVSFAWHGTLVHLTLLKEQPGKGRPVIRCCVSWQVLWHQGHYLSNNSFKEASWPIISSKCVHIPLLNSLPPAAGLEAPCRQGKWASLPVGSLLCSPSRQALVPVSYIPVLSHSPRDLHSSLCLFGHRSLLPDQQSES